MFHPLLEHFTHTFQCGFSTMLSDTNMTSHYWSQVCFLFFLSHIHYISKLNCWLYLKDKIYGYFKDIMKMEHTIVVNLVNVSWRVQKANDSSMLLWRMGDAVIRFSPWCQTLVISTVQVSATRVPCTGLFIFCPYTTYNLWLRLKPIFQHKTYTYTHMFSQITSTVLTVRLLGASLLKPPLFQFWTDSVQLISACRTRFYTPAVSCASLYVWYSYFK